MQSLAPAQRKRLGIDIGTNSIGWWLYSIGRHGGPESIIDGGVRIFSSGRDPKSGASLAVDRRVARGMRRRRDRYLRRRSALIRRLAEAGLMPQSVDEQKVLLGLDPYLLRAKGLDERLTLGEFGRALFHLNQRRGFKSNRKTDGRDNEAGLIATANARLDQEMMASGARTYGEFLHQRRAAAEDGRFVPQVRTRLALRVDPETGKEVSGYDFYASRSHLEDEFNALWEAQAQHHREALPMELRDVLFETIFYQRPLKVPVVGRCLYLDESRLAKAHPLFQQRVLYETVNNLRVAEAGQSDRPLSLDERDKIILEINGKTAKNRTAANCSFARLRRTIGLNKDQSFTLETANRKGIDCDQLRSIFAYPERFGARWYSFDEDSQLSIIKRLQDDTDEKSLVTWLQSKFALTQENALAIARAPLPQGYGRIGETASRRLLDRMTAEVITYAAAAEAEFRHHSDFRTGEVLETLPYYGKILDRHVMPGSSKPADDDVERYGRLTNPTVHIGLNQLRRLVNTVIAAHGKPDEIVIELARDLKMNDEQKKDHNIRIKRDTESAIARGKKLEEIGQQNTGANRLLLRLWEELNLGDPLDPRCPYSGQPISISMLFSGVCDIDHILPHSRTLDDSIGNRILCLRAANRGKGNKTPWESWGGTERWQSIIEPLIHRLPHNKRWRFAPDAMLKFEGDRDFLARQLNDTQYLSRIAREYLSRLYPEVGSAPVWVVPGRLTEMLRRHWGLNSLLSDSARGGLSKVKNRQDHRHHAIDAAVIGATDRGLLQMISREAGRREQDGLEDVIGAVAPPWETFRDDVKRQLDKIVVSHRSDHGHAEDSKRDPARDSTSGQLHNDTAYGLTGMRSAKSINVPLVVTRKPLLALKRGDLEKIRDLDLQAALRAATDGIDEKHFEAALSNFSAKSGPYQGIRRVRLIDAISVIEICDGNGQPYKAYKGDSNYCYEVWRLPNGKWERVVYTTFEAHRRDLVKKPHPAAKRLMRLHKKDTIFIDHPKTGPIYAVVAKLSEQKIELYKTWESDVDTRNRDKKDPFSYLRVAVSTLQKCKARRVIVDAMGHVKDPGVYE